MNAPLSRFLTRFPRGDEPNVILLDAPPDLPALPPVVEPSEAEIALREALVQTEADHATAIAALETEHAQALEAASVAARAAWAEERAETMVAALDAALATLRDQLRDGIAGALRPLVVDAIVAKTIDALDETIDRILRDPQAPCLTIRGPGDLLAALQARRPGAEGMIYETADGVEVIVIADGMHIETRLARALHAATGVEA